MSVDVKIAEALATGRRVLGLSSMDLETLPASIGELSALWELFINSNRFMVLPAVICDMTWLRVLSLMNNQLAELPDAFGQLGALVHLDLEGNRFTRLPASICELIALESLDLSYNQLVSLPEALGQLVKLKSLYLNGNRFTTLPKALVHLANLTWLWLEENRLGAFMGCFGTPTLVSVRARWAHYHALHAALGHLPWELREMIAGYEMGSCVHYHGRP